MFGFSRPFGSLVCCGGALGVAVAGTWAYGAVDSAPVVTMPAVTVTALPPLPPPESLAAMLVSPGGARSSRGTTRVLLEALEVIDWVPSSSDRADLLSELAEFPELDSTVIASVARSAMRIASPSQRSRVLRTLIRNHPDATDAARRPVLEAIGTMQSTPERTMTLELFVSSRPMSQQALVDALVQVERLRADNERSRVLVAAARSQRVNGRARSVYVRLAAGMNSDSYRRRALSAIGSSEHRRRR